MAQKQSTVRHGPYLSSTVKPSNAPHKFESAKSVVNIVKSCFPRLESDLFEDVTYSRLHFSELMSDQIS